MALTGIAILENGLPAKGVSITFVEPKVGMDAIKLPTTKEVDDAGAFEVEADVAADLLAKVKVGDRELLLSPVDTGPEGTLLFTIPTDAVQATSEFRRMNSEFARVTEAVTAVTGQHVTLATLSEQGDRQDLSLLHRETRWDASVLALRVLADRATTPQRSTDPNPLGITKEAAYGALRAGLPTDPTQLATIHPDVFASALEAADQAGVIAMSADERKQDVEEFSKFRTAELLFTKPGGGASPVRDLIANAPVPKSEREHFEKLIHESWNQGPTRHIWDQTPDPGLSQDTIARLKVYGYLAFLTLNNTELINRVKDHFSVVERFSDDLVGGTNVYDKKETWIELIDDGVPLPESFATIEPPAEARVAYAGEIVRRVMVSFPTEVVAALVARKEVTPHDNPDINTKVAELLRMAAAAGFRLGEQSPSDFLATDQSSGAEEPERKDVHQALAKLSEDDRKAVHEALATLHRLYQITPNNDMLALLSRNGIHSAQEVAQYSLDEFVTVIGRQTSSRADVHLVHKRAVQVSSLVYTFFSMARQSMNSPGGVRSATTRDDVRQRAIESLASALPSLESLFGPMDYVEGDNCRSVLGPAAYLVDLLKFLDIDDRVWEGFVADWRRQNSRDEKSQLPFGKPFDELGRRRPDIVNLQLSCENVTTEIPTIDLVNEILEYRLLVDSDGRPTVPRGGVRDSGATLSADVLAEPEFVHHEVYNRVLPNASYPHILPFDLWHATATEFAQWLGLPLWRLRRAFPISVEGSGDADEPAKRGAADVALVLGCSPDEYRLLSDPTAEAIHARYGFSQKDETKTLTGAQVLARRLDVSYLDLARLLESRFVNPGLDDLGWVLAAGISVASAREWREHHHLAVDTPPTNADIKPLWRRLTACRDRLGAVDTTHELPAGSADSKLRGLADAAFERVVVLHNPLVAVEAGPDGELHSVSTSSDFSRTSIRTGLGDLSGDPLEELLLRLDILVRLQRRLDWSIDELDTLLANSADHGTGGAHDFTGHDLTSESLEAGLARIAVVLELQTLLPDARRSDLVALVTGVNTLGLNSAYRRLFLSRPVAHRDSAFDAPFGNYLLDAGGKKLKVGDHMIGLQSGLGLTHGEIAAVVSKRDAPARDLAEVDLDIELISDLYRQALLSRLLKVSVADLAAMRHLSGLPSSDLPAIVELMQQIQAAGLSVPEIESLLATGTDRADGSQIRPNVPDELREACRKVQQARAARDEKNADATQKAANAEANAKAAREKAEESAKGEDEDERKKTGLEAKAQEDLSSRAKQAQEVARQDGAANVADAARDARTAILESTGPSAALASALLLGDPWPGMDAADGDPTEPEVGPDGKRDDDGLKPDEVLNNDGEYPRDLTADTLFSRYAPYLPTATRAHPDGKEPTDPPAGAVGQSPRDIDTPIEQAHVLLAKTVFLAGRLGLIDAEIRALDLATMLDVRHDLADPAAATDPSVTPAEKVRERVRRLRELLTYCELRRSVAAGSPEFVEVLSASTSDEAAERLAARAAGYTASMVHDATRAMGESTTAEPGVKVPRLARICEVIGMAAKVGVPPATLREWVEAMIPTEGASTGAEQRLVVARQRQAVAKQIKDAARAHLGSRWNQVAAPVSDRLRQRQRDALVALCLHTSGRRRRDNDNPDSGPKAGERRLETMEQLFEDLLLDPGSEPVLRTSRIRQAISAVQLFVQRVLLNLEPNVHPSSVKASQWEWMKRYRVWEANRRIFLFPENWLEPEFRDDKSHLFAELESTLLQSDVTNDIAEDALLTYLRQLDEIARLDIVATHCEQDYLDPSSNTLHVIGRTFASPHRYFYRRMAHGIWTPWEPVDLDITGDDLVLAHWRDRLYLFWVTHLPKKEEPSTPGSTPAAETELIKVNLKQLRQATGEAPPRLMVQLHWSEYVGGSWSPTSASGFVQVDAGAPVLSSPFKSIHSVIDDDSVQIHLNGVEGIGAMVFALRGRNSPVETGGEFAGRSAGPYGLTAQGELDVQFAPIITSVKGGTSNGIERETPVLGKSVGRPSLVHPVNDVDLGGPDIGPLVSPFFYADAMRTFFVQPSLTEDTIEKSVETWTMVETSPPPPPKEEGKAPWFTFVVQAQGPRLYPPAVEKALANRPQLADQVINSNTVVAFDDRLVGPRGTISATHFRSARLRGEPGLATDTIGELHVVPSFGTDPSHVGSLITAEPSRAGGSADRLHLHDVVTVEQSAIAAAGLATGSTILVQGGGGLFGRRPLSHFRATNR